LVHITKIIDATYKIPSLYQKKLKSRFNALEELGQ
jgi:hypothetical protein